MTENMVLTLEGLDVRVYSGGRLSFDDGESHVEVRSFKKSLLQGIAYYAGENGSLLEIWRIDLFNSGNGFCDHILVFRLWLSIASSGQVSQLAELGPKSRKSNQKPGLGKSLALERSRSLPQASFSSRRSRTSFFIDFTNQGSKRNRSFPACP